MTDSNSAHVQEEHHGSFKSYTIGFICSIILTVIPIAVVLNEWLQGTGLALVLMIAAVLQLFVQLLFFMHLREEKNPRYNLISLILGLVILVVIVAGSIWIMLNNMVAL
ncbi:cytochrome o ubiquinol oxidase operon protein cyoD [Paenibacillus uliginis N3/975]|uniref:Cytochrome o ubiquinol oxidase operon protein cyoD n=1 Tax=Paenibacillus uliginis N3/975 TaxID=1313296 RepID=A0A1X7HDG8_9BACL|nr:cytochrome o ubiquinol oxidase subunit IV [Paenibacillus uliginis]SMF83526.1 cytochrome o ubiquinol oxidase operon protein cyoD [Paenibacillus uliginis N3/975]